MTPEEQLREQRQALNAAINSRDLETVTSFLHPDFVAKGPGGHAFDRQAAIRELEHMLQPSMNLHSEIEVEHVEVSGDSAKLRVRRTEQGQIMYQPGRFGVFLAMGGCFAIMAIISAVTSAVSDKPENFPFQTFLIWVGIVVVAVCSVGSFWSAYRVGPRTMHQTQRAEETWQCLEGRWLLASEEQIS